MLVSFNTPGARPDNALNCSQPTTTMTTPTTPFHHNNPAVAAALELDGCRFGKWHREKTEARIAAMIAKHGVTAQHIQDYCAARGVWTNLPTSVHDAALMVSLARNEEELLYYRCQLALVFANRGELVSAMSALVEAVFQNESLFAA